MEVKENRDAQVPSFMDSGPANPVLFVESILALHELSKLTCLLRYYPYLGEISKENSFEAYLYKDVYSHLNCNST